MINLGIKMGKKQMIRISINQGIKEIGIIIKRNLFTNFELLLGIRINLGEKVLDKLMMDLKQKLYRGLKHIFLLMHLLLLLFLLLKILMMVMFFKNFSFGEFY